MNNFSSILNKKFLLSLFCFSILLTTFTVQTLSAQTSAFGVQEPAGCTRADPMLPALLICGRSPNQTDGEGAKICQAYTKPCTVADIIETIRRVIIWLLTISLLVVPLVVVYYGVQLMIYKEGAYVDKIAWARKNLGRIILYFIIMLAAWSIVRTIVGVFQVRSDVPSFLIDDNGQDVNKSNTNFLPQ